jgi:hypothetical protein
LTLREENWVLEIIYGPKRDEMTGESIKLHKEELHSLYSLQSSRRVRWAKDRD